MKLALRLIREQLRGRTAAVLLMLLIAMVATGSPYVFSFLGKWLVDGVLQVSSQGGEGVGGVELGWTPTAPEEKVRLLVVFFVASMGIHLLVSGLSLLSELVSSKTIQRMTYDMRRRVHERIVTADAQFVSREQVGQLMTRIMDDSAAVPGNILNLVINAVAHVVMLVLGVVLLVKLNPAMAALAAATLPFYAVTCVIFLPRIQKNTVEVRDRWSELIGFAVERIGNVATIKNYAQEDAEVDRFSERVGVSLGLGRRQQHLNLFFGTITGVITALAALAVLAVGFVNIRGLRMQVGEVLAFYQVTAQLFVPLSALVSMTVVIQTLRVYAERLYSVIDAPTRIVRVRPGGRRPAVRGDVEFLSVSLRYDEGGPFALHDVGLRIAEGSTCALVGPTGCGKSSVIALMTRLYDPTSGTIRIGGRDLREFTVTLLRRKIGNVLYEPGVFTGTIAENIAYGVPDASENRIRAAGRQAGLQDFIEGLPDRYATKVGSGGLGLERDELVRLSLARALITNPSVVTIDDTFSSVEEATEARLYEAIRRALPNKTLVMASSRLTTASRCDVIFVLQQGSLVEQGTHDELMSAAGLYQRMYARQMGLPAGADS